MCETTAFPVTAPRLWGGELSPQSTVRSLTALPFDVAAVTAKVNAAGKPTLGAVVGGVITTDGAFVTTTVTEPDAVPDELGVGGAGALLVELELPPPAVLVGAWAPTDAVTVACWLVMSTADAMPLASVGTIEEDKLPAVVLNCTGVDASGLPFTSSTVAVIAEAPPIAGTVLGFAVTATRPTAALPTAIRIPLFVPVVAAPDDAVMMAVPLLLPARNVTMARPLTSVSASAG